MKKLIFLPFLFLFFSCPEQPPLPEKTAPPPLATPFFDSALPPEHLGIFYGWPSLVNGAGGNTALAADYFDDFDLVVLGDGLEDPSHGDHQPTEEIIGLLNTRGTAVFGYVDLGVTTQNLTVPVMKTYCDQWKAMGAAGIFFDNAGYDFEVTRSRQNLMIRYCHKKNLRVFMNAWNIEDVAGGNSLLGPGDVYLSESVLVSNGKYLSVEAWKTKGDLCLDYKKSLGIEIACVSTAPGGTVLPEDYNQTNRFNMPWFGTAMYGFDYFQATDYWYSASNNSLKWFPNISENYGISFPQPYPQYGSPVPPYGVYRDTESWRLEIQGDGSTWGYGTFIGL